MGFHKSIINMSETEIYHDDITWVPKSEYDAALKMLDEMAEDLYIFSHTDEYGVVKASQQCDCEVLDRYRKFKEGLK